MLPLFINKVLKMRSSFSLEDCNSKRWVRNLFSFSNNFIIEQDMFAYFSQFGTVGDAIVMRDKNTGRGRGFGFIRLIFKDDDEAQKMKDHIIR